MQNNDRALNTYSDGLFCTQVSHMSLMVLICTMGFIVINDNFGLLQFKALWSSDNFLESLLNSLSCLWLSLCCPDSLAPQTPALGLCSGYSLSNYNNALKIFVNKTWFHNLIGLSPRIGFVLDNQFIIQYVSSKFLGIIYSLIYIYLFQKLQQYHQHRRSSSFIGPVSFQRNFIVSVFVFVSKIVPLNLVVQMTKVTERWDTVSHEDSKNTVASLKQKVLTYFTKTVTQTKDYL